MTLEEKKARLEQVNEMLKARTDMKGKPLPGYQNNVLAVKAEIEKLTAEIAELEGLYAENAALKAEIGQLKGAENGQ